VKTAEEIFIETKQAVKELVSTRPRIKEWPKDNTPGIYLLYVDSFDSPIVIPFYIGKAGAGFNNKGGGVQGRYNAHLENVMVLNRFNGSYLEYLLKESSYLDGRFLYVKILKYLIENQCSLNDIKAVLLEESEGDDAELYKLERKWMDQLHAPFFGFNQVNTITEGLRKDTSEEGYVEESDKNLREDLCDSNKYFGLGYTRFNARYALDLGYGIDKEYEDNDDIEALMALEELRAKDKDAWSAILSNHSEISATYERYRQSNEELEAIELELKEKGRVLKGRITRLFKKYKVKAKRVRKLCDDSYFSRDENERESARSAFEKSMKRYKNERGIIEALSLQDTPYLEIRRKYSFLKEKCSELSNQMHSLLIRKRELKQEWSTELIPSTRYTDAFPVGDRYCPYYFPPAKNEAFTCQIRFEVGGSYHTKNKIEILRIDYQIIRDKAVLGSDGFFINCVSADCFLSGEMGYGLRQAVFVDNFYRQFSSVFLPTEYLDSHVRCFTHYYNVMYMFQKDIAVSAERGTGINLGTFRGKTTVTLFDAFKEIENECKRLADETPVRFEIISNVYTKTLRDLLMDYPSLLESGVIAEMLLSKKPGSSRKKQSVLILRDMLSPRVT